MALKDRIKAHRTALNLTQGELAALVSQREGLATPLSWQTIQQWEAGTGPKRSRLPFVADALGTTVAALLHDGEPAEPPAVHAPQTARETPANPYAWPFKTVSAASVADLPPATRQTLERIIAAFLAQPASVEAAAVDYRDIAHRVARANNNLVEQQKLLDFLAKVDRKLAESARRGTRSAPPVKIHEPS